MASLTDVKLKALRPQAKPYKLADGDGMYLLITPTGGKLWRLDYRYGGKRKTLALGAYPETSAAAARESRRAARELLAKDIDPGAQRKTDKQARQLAAENSFAAVAGQWFENWKAARSTSHVGYVWRRLQADVFPAIGARPVSEIEAPALVAMTKKTAARGALDIAKRNLQTCGQVFRYAIAHGLATRNPATDIKPADILPSRAKTHYARIDAQELPNLLRKIEAYQGSAVTRLAMKLMALTFVRTGELIGAPWAEFDFDARRWNIPEKRMKMRSPHIVPLSKQAMEVLRTLRTVTGNGKLLFPGERDHDKPMSNNTILQALNRMGYRGAMTGHGFRGVASTILHEQGFEHAHIELQLAHQERDAVSAAYNHATYLPQRAKMMQAWANYLDAQRGSNVVPVDFAKAA